MLAFSLCSGPLAGLAAVAEPTPRPVLTVVAEHPAALAERRFFGIVTARETLMLAFDVGGRIDMVAAVEGQRVSAGEILARLRLSPFERALARAEIARGTAERESARAAALVASAAISAARAEDAAAVLALADVALGDAREALADATLRAPVDGMVVARLVPPFATVEPGQPVLTLHDLSEIRVEIVLPERLVTRIGTLDAVSFEATMPGDSSPTTLAVAEFRAEADRIGQGYRLALALPEGAATRLLPGASLEVTARLPAEGDALALPPAAVQVGADGAAFVVALTETATGPVATHLPVEVRSTDGVSVRVTGIAPGVEVVAAGAHLVTEGETVRRFTGLRPDGR